MAKVSLRALGRSGLSVSRLALSGSFGITADDAMRGFEELGVSTFFLTNKSHGLIEAVKRIVASGRRNEITVVSTAIVPLGFTLGRELKRMSNALGVDAIDVFLLGWVQYHWYVTGKTWTTMRKLKADGLVRSLGISCHDRPLARSLVDELELDVVMLRYNAAHRGAEGEVFGTLDPNNRPGIISYTATRWGGLLKPTGDLGPMTPGECYQFALGHPLVDTALCGARSFSELAENAAAVNGGPIAEARLAEVKRFGDAVRGKVSSRVAFGGA
jgi:predicted aldo/keto reductase-like oxidoreductase